jgi:hypothetical protein
MSTNRIDHWLFEQKVGFDWANKKMLVRIYEHLKNEVDNGAGIWKNAIVSMLDEGGALNAGWKPNPNGYYATIKRILKDIDVIRVEKRKLIKGSNWDRFYSEDEDWSWFITNTNSGGYGKIIK